MPGLLSEDDLTPQQREFARRYLILFTDEPQAVPRGGDGAEVKRARTMGRRPALLGGPSDPSERSREVNAGVLDAVASLVPDPAQYAAALLAGVSLPRGVRLVETDGGWMVRMRDGCSLEPPRRTGSLEQMASLLTPLAASAGRPAGSLGAGPGRRLPSGPPPAAPTIHGVGDHGRDLFDYSRLHEVPDVPQEPVSSGALDAGGEAIRRGWPDTVSL